MTQKPDLGTMYLTQQSLTEWLEDINHHDAEALRKEDNEKRERLAVLKKVAGVPYDEQVKFTARDVADNSPVHAKFVEEHGDELCALRLIPLDSSLPKLRMRGRTVRDVQAWFADQHIDPDKYRAEYIPHVDDQLFSTIFVVNDKGIFGEIIKGRHSQLTQGIYDGGHRPSTFSFDFSTWRMVPESLEALEHMKLVVSYLLLDAKKQEQLRGVLGASFAHGYVKGYFETTSSDEFGLWFVDYSQAMGKLIGDIAAPLSDDGQALVKGQVGSTGHASGIVKIVHTGDTAEAFPDGAILVSEMTTPDLVPLMKKAAGIVTDNGGILSHAAIVARELKKPCIVGTGNATNVLKDGDTVLVDTTAGEVRKI
jgi:phosphohistidine swiveling domain-containing protein